jgi:hypothetical protein
VAIAGWRRPGIAAAAAVTLLGCKDDGATTVDPVIDVPTSDDPDATAAPLDTITVTVAHARSNNDLVSQSFTRGQPLVVPDVPFGDDLVIHMTGFVGQSSVAYGRTCAMEVDAGSPAPTPHLFFSRSVKFATTSIAPLPRIGGVGVPYLGTALFVGGLDGNSDPVNNVERFDPVTGTLTQIGTLSPRAQVAQALIGTAPPRVALIGGMSLMSSVPMTGARVVEVLDDQHIDRFDNTEMGRVGLSATALVDGRVIVIGGNPPPNGAAIGDIDEVTQTDSVEARKLNASLAFPRTFHTATRLGDDVGAPVLIAGGIGPDGAPVQSPELFKPLSEELANPAMFAAEKMVVPR